MELDELKLAWEGLSKQVEKQQTVTNQMIEQMMQLKYRSKINKIAYPEMIGSVILFAAAAVLLFNFNRLSAGWMQVFGSLSVLFMVILPVLSLSSISRLQRLGLASLTYAEIISAYSHQKIKFQRIQKVSFYITFAFMLTFFPVVLNLMGKDMGQLPAYFWYVILPAGMIVFVIAARWVMKSYNSVLRGAQSLLKEVEDRG